MTLFKPAAGLGTKKAVRNHGENTGAAPEHLGGGAADERPYLAGGAASL